MFLPFQSISTRELRILPRTSDKQRTAMPRNMLSRDSCNKAHHHHLNHFSPPLLALLLPSSLFLSMDVFLSHLLVFLPQCSPPDLLQLLLLHLLAGINQSTHQCCTLSPNPNQLPWPQFPLWLEGSLTCA